MAWEPETEEQYVEALHKAQLKTEQHKWDQAEKLRSDSEEKEAKRKKDEEEAGDKPKAKKSWL